MEVKGTAVITIPDFIKKEFGDNHYQEWLEALPPDSKKIFQEKILIASWYPIEEALLTPTRVVCDIFYDSSSKGAWELGKYSAKESLSGVYKIFIKIINPKMLVDRGVPILKKYYNPIEMNILGRSDSDFIIEVFGLTKPSIYIDNRIGGWIETACGLAGARNVKVQVIKHGEHTNGTTKLQATWDY